uniref:Uncharacterized protein n=1 Tax=Trichuris muris TaxID=70415 RepID=A0A5S6QMM7_TRIMR
MLDKDTVKPSCRPWMTAVAYRVKRPGEVSKCVDYCELCKRAQKDAYPQPIPDDMFEKVLLNSCKKDDVEKANFSPDPGMELYQFKRMPFGLCGVPNSLQSATDDLLRDLPVVVVFALDKRSHY